MDKLGNTIAKEGCDRCFCGCKYWENDRCVDCGTNVTTVKVQRARDIMDRLDIEDDDNVRADLFDEIIGLADDVPQVKDEWKAYR